MKKNLCKFTAIYLLILQILLITPPIKFSSIEAEAIDGDIVNVDMSPTLSAPMIDIDNSITVKYDNINSLDYDVEFVPVGIEATLIEEDEYLEIEIRGITTEDFGTLTVNALANDGTAFTDTLYTYNNGYSLHVSDLGKDQALYQGLKEMYDMNTEDNTVITAEECEEIYSAFSSDYISVDGILDIVLGNETTLISGHVYWETDGTPKPGETKNPNLPFRNGKVEIGIKVLGTFVPVGSGYTNQDGKYDIDIEHSDILDGSTLYIRAKLSAETFFVASDWFFDHYYYEAELLQEGIEAGSHITAEDYTLEYSTDTQLYKATYVHQAMVIGERFALEMGMETDRIVRVAYPGGVLKSGIDDELEDMAFCGGNIFNTSYSVIGVDSYNDTEMIVHEYSHYVQMSLGNYGATLVDIALYDPEHYEYWDAYAKKENKKFATHLAWSEGWGYAFSVMAQKYYQSEYSGMKNYDTTQTLINTYNHDDFYGEFQEKTVKAFLWELLDQSKIVYNPDAPVEELDYQLPWTPQEWWNMTTVSGTCRFPDFMRLIEEEGYDESMDIDYKSVREGISEYLTKYNIAPQINSITYTSGTPTINVKVNGSIAYPNNRLVIKVFDENNNLLSKSDMIEVNRGRFDNFNLTIPTTVWNEVLSKCSCTDGQTTNLKISVVGYREDTTDPDGTAIESQFRKTGPYYSEYEELPITHEYTYSSVNAATHNRYCSGCETTTVQPHRFVYSKFNDAMHFARCADCGYFQFMSHNMVYEQVDGRYHEHHCSYCSHSEGNSLHVLKSNGSTDRYQNCTACGALVDTGINMFPIIKNKIEEEEYTE